MKKVLYILGWIIRLLSAAVALSLCCAYLSRFVSPAFTWIFAFFGLIFPQSVIANLLLFVCWLALKQKTCIIHLIVLIPAFFFLPAYIQLRSQTGNEKKESNELKVLTYNVHLLGIDTRNKTLKTLPGIANFIKKEAPDIICLQEVVAFDTNQIKKAFKEYPYTNFHARKLSNNIWFSTVILSRQPIKNKGAILFSNTGNVCIYTDIAINNNIIRVYNNHLESTGLNLKLSFSHLKREDKRNEEIIKVSSRLRDAFIKRAKQVDTVAAHVAACSYPVLVCGDFNDLPMSYTYRKMKGKLGDPFITAGSGIPSSFHSRLPAFRIDYIFNDTFFKATQYYIPKIKYSDHYPVITVFKMNLQRPSE